MFKCVVSGDDFRKKIRGGKCECRELCTANVMPAGTMVVIESVVAVIAFGVGVSPVFKYPAAVIAPCLSIRRCK